MEAILFIGHGSRDPEGNWELLQFTKKVAAGLREPIVETCFLELTQPDIAEGIRRAVERGATTIKVIPLMLFKAGHAKIHIPLALHEAEQTYPQVKFVYARPVEVDEMVLPLLEERCRLAETKEDKETAVLFVGRGSSDAGANSDLFKIARLLWERLSVKWVEVCFIGVTDPRLEEGLRRCVRLGAKNVIVLPYFLFTGVLIKRMAEMIRHFHVQYPEISVEMVPYLGFDDGLIPIWEGRVAELEEGRGLDWRELAHQAITAGHHHHHNHHHHHGHHHHPKHA